MTIIDRHIIREISRYFGWILTTVTAIYIIADFFERIDDLVASQMPFAKAALLFLSRIPFEHLIPVSILLAVLVVFGLMGRHNELTALKTSGVSIYRCLRAPLTAGVGACIFMVVCAEMMLPILRSTANRYQLETGKQVQINTRRQDVWLRGERFIAHIRQFDVDKSMAFGVSINFFDAKFRLVRRIEARRVQFHARQWSCYDTVEQRLNPADEMARLVHHAHMDTPAYFELVDLKHGVKPADEMGVVELAAYIRTVAGEGYDTTALRVDWQAKIAFPLVCILLAVMAAAIAGRPRRSQGLASVVLAGLGLSFFFWVVRSFSLALGYAAVLPPFLAAWIPILIYAGTTAVFLLRAE
jgi:lipopolysaccharide export system permease protein